MEMAISAGVRAPIGTPTGPWSSIELLGCHTRGAQSGEPRAVRFSAAQATDIEGARAKGDQQRRIVELRIVRERHHRRALVRAQLAQGFIRPFVDDGKPAELLSSGERSPRIDQDYRVAGRLGHASQRLGDVHRADDDQSRRRTEHLKEDASLLALDGQALVRREQPPRLCYAGTAQGEIPDFPVRQDQRLLAGPQLRRQDCRNAGRLGLQHCFQDRPPHSILSTKISMRPPHARPTSHAI